MADGAGYVALPIAAVIGYSAWKLPGVSQPCAWLFVVALSGVTALALALPDLLFGGQRSTFLIILPRFSSSIRFQSCRRKWNAEPTTRSSPCTKRGNCGG